MLREVRLPTILAILTLAAVCAVSTAGAQRRTMVASHDASGDLGPEMTEFMTFLDAELAELTHLHDAGDVPPADFRVSRDRLAATREAALRIARARHEDRVPDLYVLVDKELTQILPAGAAAIREGKSAIGSATTSSFMAAFGRAYPLISWKELAASRAPRRNRFNPKHLTAIGFAACRLLDSAGIVSAGVPNRRKALVTGAL